MKVEDMKDMKVEDFVQVAEKRRQEAEEKAEARRQDQIESNSEDLWSVLSTEAFLALGIDPSVPPVETEGTSEVYVKGEFTIDGEQMWIQLNRRFGNNPTEATLQVVLGEDRVLAHPERDVLQKGQHAENTVLIGKLVKNALESARATRENERKRRRSYISEALRTLPESPDEAMDRMRLIKDMVVSLEDNPLTEEDHQEFLNIIGTRVERIQFIQENRVRVAREIAKAAADHALVHGFYLNALRAYVDHETARLWSPWEARLIVYPLVEGTVHVSAWGGADEEGETLDLESQLTRTAVVLPTHDPDGWLQEIHNDGAMDRLQVGKIAETRPLNFSERETERPLPYHRSHHAGHGLWINVPPVVEGEPGEAPVPPSVTWGHRLDSIEGVEIFDDDTIDRLHVDRGHTQHEHVRSVLSDYL